MPLLRLDVVTDGPRRAAFGEVPNRATNRFAINLGHRARLWSADVSSHLSYGWQEVLDRLFFVRQKVDGKYQEKMIKIGFVLAFGRHRSELKNW